MQLPKIVWDISTLLLVRGRLIYHEQTVVYFCIFDIWNYILVGIISSYENYRVLIIVNKQWATRYTIPFTDANRDDP